MDSLSRNVKRASAVDKYNVKQARAIGIVSLIAQSLA